MLADILKRLPEQIETYYEPFVGGGAVFFALAREGRFRHAVLSDANPDLIDVYWAVQNEIEKLIGLLKKLREGHCEAQYYAMREQRPRARAQRAARIIYLNKTGYNGLYRVNRSGGFNVPYGRYAKPNICDEPNLRAAHEALRAASIEVADFEDVCARARPGDAVYLDPPYVPLSKTASFTAYDRNPFGMEEQTRLAGAFAALAERGVHGLLSNSATSVTRALYAKFQQETIRVARSINSRPDARGPVDELLVTTSAAPVRAAAKRVRAR